MNMNVLILQKHMSLSKVKLPNIDQIDCQFIGVFLLTDEKNYAQYIDLHSKCKNFVLTSSLPNFKVKHQVALFKINKEKQFFTTL
jgi:hypothetical protein